MPNLMNYVVTAGMNSDAQVFAKTMPVGKITVDPDLAGIFRIDSAVLAAVTKGIKEKGFDDSQPLVLWKGRDAIVDGHTRYRAAVDAGLVSVPVVLKDFESLDEAKLYAYHRQAQRRNLTQAEIYEAAVTLKIKTDTRDGSGRTRDQLGEEIGVSGATIAHARTVDARASEDVKAAVKAGEMSINKAYNTVKTPKPKVNPAPANGPVYPPGGYPVRRDSSLAEPSFDDLDAASEKAECAAPNEDVFIDPGDGFDTIGDIAGPVLYEEHNDSNPATGTPSHHGPVVVPLVDALMLLACGNMWSACKALVYSNLVEDADAVLNLLPEEMANNIRD